MNEILFQTDEILLFELDFLPNDRQWFNLMVRKDKKSYEVYLTECNPKTNITRSRYLESFKSQAEAKEKSIALARILNKLTFQAP